MDFGQRSEGLVNEMQSSSVGTEETEHLLLGFTQHNPDICNKKSNLGVLLAARDVEEASTSWAVEHSFTFTSGSRRRRAGGTNPSGSLPLSLRLINHVVKYFSLVIKQPQLVYRSHKPSAEQLAPCMGIEFELSHARN